MPSTARAAALLALALAATASTVLGESLSLDAPAVVSEFPVFSTFPVEVQYSATGARTVSVTMFILPEDVFAGSIGAPESVSAGNGTFVRDVTFFRDGIPGKTYLLRASMDGNSAGPVTAEATIYAASVAPTSAPSLSPPPTHVPTAPRIPTATPTGSPTATPTGSPTATPTATPTAAPTLAPSAFPTHAPTVLDDRITGFEAPAVLSAFSRFYNFPATVDYIATGPRTLTATLYVLPEMVFVGTNLVSVPVAEGAGSAEVEVWFFREGVPGTSYLLEAVMRSESGDAVDTEKAIVVATTEAPSSAPSGGPQP